MRSVLDPSFSFLCKVNSILIVVHQVEVSTLDLVIS